MLFSQVTEAVSAGSKALEGRSESLIVVVIGVGLIVFVMWRDSKKQEREDKRQDRRDEIQAKKDLADSDSLRLISESMQRVGIATETVAQTVEKIEQRQECDRRAILQVIESVDAKTRGDEQSAAQSLRDAKTILVSGD